MALDVPALPYPDATRVGAPLKVPQPRREPAAATAREPSLRGPVLTSLPAAAALPAPPRARVGTGNTHLDDLLLGGLAPGSATLLLGPPHAGQDVLAASFALRAASEGEPLVVVVTGMSPASFRHQVAALGRGFEDHEASGRVAFIDAHAGLLGQLPEDPRVVAAPRPWEPDDVAGAFALARETLAGPPRLSLVVQSLSDLALRAGPEQAAAGHPWLARLLAQARTSGGTSLLTATEGVHAPAEAALLRHLADGALELVERDDARTFLRARGLPAATRAWIEYEAAPDRFDVVGSLTEHKIR